MTFASENVARSTFDYDIYSQTSTTQNFNGSNVARSTFDYDIYSQTSTTQNFNGSKVNSGEMDTETFFNNTNEIKYDYTHRTQYPICHERYQRYLCHRCLDLGAWLEEGIFKYKNSHPSEIIKDLKHSTKNVFIENIVEFISVIKYYYEIVYIPECVLLRVSETDFEDYNLLCISMILAFIYMYWLFFTILFVIIYYN